MIERKKYLDKLIRKKENGMVKVITGIADSQQISIDLTQLLFQLTPLTRITQ